jgi:hypothetical protein
MWGILVRMRLWGIMVSGFNFLSSGGKSIIITSGNY